MSTEADSSAQTFVNVAGAVGLLVLGLGAVAPISVVFAPYSFVILIPAFLIASALGEAWLFVGGALGALITPIVYIAAARHILKTGKPLPIPSVIAFVALTLLSLIYAIIGWETTVRYTSVTRAASLVIQALAPPVIIGICTVALRKSITVRQSLWLHWLALAWVTWSAFPWYGELL